MNRRDEWLTRVTIPEECIYPDYVIAKGKRTTGTDSSRKWTELDARMKFDNTLKTKMDATYTCNEMEIKKCSKKE